MTASRPHRFWIKTSQTSELRFSPLCILCSPSAKLPYKWDFHSQLQNEPCKVISYSFSFPPQNVETRLRGEGQRELTELCCWSRSSFFAERVTTLHPSWWCVGSRACRHLTPCNTHTQSPCIFCHQNMGALGPSQCLEHSHLIKLSFWTLKLPMCLPSVASQFPSLVLNSWTFPC